MMSRSVLKMALAGSALISAQSYAADSWGYQDDEYSEILDHKDLRRPSGAYNPSVGDQDKYDFEFGVQYLSSESLKRAGKKKRGYGKSRMIESEAFVDLDASVYRAYRHRNPSRATSKQKKSRNVRIQDVKELSQPKSEQTVFAIYTLSAKKKAMQNGDVIAVDKPSRSADKILVLEQNERDLPQAASKLNRLINETAVGKWFENPAVIFDHYAILRDFALDECQTKEELQQELASYNENFQSLEEILLHAGLNSMDDYYQEIVGEFFQFMSMKSAEVKEQVASKARELGIEFAQEWFKPRVF